MSSPHITSTFGFLVAINRSFFNFMEVFGLGTIIVRKAGQTAAYQAANMSAST